MIVLSKKLRAIWMHSFVIIQEGYEKMKRAEIELIKKSFWDYDFKDSEIEKRISFLRKGIISDERFFLRILENFSWHFLIELIPEDILLSLLTDKLINKIRSKRRRENLANAKSILLGSLLLSSEY